MNDLTTRLKDILAKEFETLSTGRFDDIQYLLDEKHALIKKLDTARLTLPPSLLLELRHLTEKNNALYSAALDGFAVIKDRLETLKDIRDGLKTYGDDGRRVSANQTAISRETRA